MFCKNCGNEIPDDVSFCPVCGKAKSITENAFDEGDHTAEFAQEDIERTHLLSAVCYLSFIFIIIALLLEPNSKFLRYHINQSILIYLLGVASAAAMIVPFIGWIIGGVASVASLIFTIMGIVRAFKGEAKDTPIIGKYTIVKYN